MFLATHGLAEYWPEDQELVLLSPGCITAKNKDYCEQRGYQMVPTLWADLAWRERASVYMLEVQEKMLANLYRVYSNIFNVTISMLEFRALMASWLDRFVQMAYDRFSHVKYALENYDISSINILASKERSAPQDENHLIRWLLGDEYTACLSGQIALLLQPTLKTISVERNLPEPQRFSFFSIGKQLVKSWIFRALKFRAKILHDSMGFNKKESLKLFFMSRGRCQPVAFHAKSENFSVAVPLREKIKLINFGQDGFIEILSRILPWHIPVGLLEGFAIQYERTKTFYPKIKHVYAANSVAQNSFQRFFYARLIKEGRLSYCQHGGGFGINKYCPDEIIEGKLSHPYCVWGWANKSNGYQNLPSPLLSRLLWKCSSNGADKGVGKFIDALLVMTNYPRFFYKNLYAPLGSQMDEYLKDACFFSRELERFIPGFKVHIREYPVRFDRVFNCLNGSREELNRLSYSEQMGVSKLVVVDHCMTTFLELLVQNRPMMAYWRSEFYEVRESARSDLRSLEEVGIYHTSPGRAVNYIRKIWGDLDAWWQSPSVQSAREAFVQKYALTSENICGDFLKLAFKKNN